MRANRYVSYLAAEIEPKAISTLNEFERQASKVMEKIGAAQQRGTAGFANAALGTAPIRNVRQLGVAADEATRKIDRATTAQLRNASASSAMGTGFQRAAQALNVVQGPLGPLAGRLSALSEVMRNLTGLSLGSVLGGGSAFALGSIASQYQGVTDRLRPMFESQREFNKAMNDVVGIAQRTRQSLTPVVDIYASLTRTGKDAGLSQDRIGRLAETVSKAAQIGGGTQQGKEAALVQFGQALSGDFKTAGQEIQSILEQTPALAQALFDGLGIKGVGAFKKLAREGELSSELIVQALERSATAVDVQFSRIPKRIGTSLTELTTQFTLFVGRTDETVGATTLIAVALSGLANNLDLVAIAVATAGAAFAASSFAAGANALVNYGKAALTAVAASNQLRASVAAGNAVVIGSAEANRQRADYIQQGARAEESAARIASQSAAQHKVAIQSQISLLDKQIAAQRRVHESARLVDAASRASGGGGRPDLVKAATEDLNRSLRARILTEQQLVAVDAELAAADARLIAATNGLNAANIASVAANDAAAAATGRLARAKVVLQGAMTKVGAAASSLVGFLGGPWGVAFTLAAAAVAYLATRTNYAAEAARAFEGDQEGLARQLGFTTGELYKQGDAARSLAVDLAKINLLKAKQKRDDIADSASAELYKKGVTTTTSLADTVKINQLGRVIQRTGGLSDRGYSELSALIKKYPSLKEDPEFQQTIIGLRVGAAQFRDAIADANKTVGELAKPRAALAPLVGGGGGGKPETAAERRARLNREAAVDGASGELARARAELSKAKAEGPGKDETDAAYVDRIAAMTRGVKALADAEKGGTAARNSGTAALARMNREIESASDKRDRLLGIMDRYTEDTPIKRLEKIRDEAEKAKRAIDDLIGEKVEGYKGAFTADDAAAAKARIDEGVARMGEQPLTDALEQGREQLKILGLQARGQGNLAELTQKRIDLEKTMKPLSEDQIDDLRSQQAEAQRLNDIIEERNGIIQNNARFLGEVRDAGRDAIRAFLGGDLKGGIKGFAKAVKNAYLDAKANEIAIKIFGDPEKKYIDKMTRGLDGSAERLGTSADSLGNAADALVSAAGAIQNGAAGSAAPDVVAGPDGTISSSMLGGKLLGTLNDISGAIQGANGSGPTETFEGDDGPPIVITGSRKKSPISLPGGIDSVLGDLFGQMSGGTATAIAGAISSIVGKAKPGGGKVGNALGSIADMAGQFVPQIAAGRAIGSAVSKIIGVPEFAGGIFGVVGNVVGSVLGLTKKPADKKGVVKLSAVNGSIVAGKATGNSKKSEAGATDFGDSVSSGLRNIAEALDATIGAFSVSVGIRNGQYRVDPTGRGKTKKSAGAKDFDEDAEAAVRFAILDALKDGAIQGIREGTQRILKAGKDLDEAIEKAVKFEGVFKALKRIKDPVGAAIDDVNKKFVDLIGIFKEAQASAAEWADLEELYGYERAEAIKEATANAVSQIDDFIKGITSGPESPLSRRTVYENAKAEVEKFRGDLAAGKPVDQDALIAALENYQSASETLNGSREQFYKDFADILALANQAKANVPQPGTGTGTLPPSPFDALPAIAERNIVIAQAQLTVLEKIRQAIEGGQLSIVDLLPGNFTLRDDSKTRVF
ncbi:MAG: tape measure protein [Pseudomonadota bacterium]